MAIYSRGVSAIHMASWESRRHSLSHFRLLSLVSPSESQPKLKLALTSALLWDKIVRKTHSFKSKLISLKSKPLTPLMILKKERRFSLKLQTRMSYKKRRRRLMLTLSMRKLSPTRKLMIVQLGMQRHLLKTARKHLKRVTMIYNLVSRSLKQKKKV